VTIGGDRGVKKEQLFKKLATDLKTLPPVKGP